MTDPHWLGGSNMSQFKGCKYASCPTVTSFTYRILVLQVIFQNMNLLSFYVSKMIAIILLKNKKIKTIGRHNSTFTPACRLVSLWKRWVVIAIVSKQGQTSLGAHPISHEILWLGAQSSQLVPFNKQKYIVFFYLKGTYS